MTSRRRPLRFVAILLFLAGLMALSWPKLEIAWYERTRPTSLPTAQPADAFASKPTEERKDEGTEGPTPDETVVDESIRSSVPQLPSSLNLDVPFTSQAPFANWDAAHEEYCEEASALMAGRFFQGRSITGPDDAEAAMGELVTWELEHLGYFESTTAQETARMIREVYGLAVTLVTDVSDEAIKQALADGKLIILPAAGRELGNPYFQRPGPVYHMLVVKGYTESSQFITNDPGTRRGADFIYDTDVLIRAVGDWNSGDPANGQSVMLVVSKV
ncbi:C39 family peptidase [Candidatus Berkelbacteria bacterium]|nr:C39 family peptidase [Candidatus Berkelbacteria bacterium]